MLPGETTAAGAPPAPLDLPFTKPKLPLGVPPVSDLTPASQPSAVATRPGRISV